VNGYDDDDLQERGNFFVITSTFVIFGDIHDMPYIPNIINQ
jgi:hypothetical protein